MRVSRIVTTAILVLMLSAVMGLRDVKAQTPVACLATPFTTGWIAMPVGAETTLVTSSLLYNAGLLGTVENFNGNVVAGLDWLYDDRQPNLETNMVGTQLVGWWTRKNGRNTIIQATNTNPDTDVPDPVTGAVAGAVTVHVQILGEDCVEIVNFCDSFTPLDTVIYDLSDLMANPKPPPLFPPGQDITDTGLAGREGIIIITPVDECIISADPVFTAVSWNFMQGNARIINVGEDWEYGTNVRARTAAPAEPWQGVPADSDRNFVWDYYTAVNPNSCNGIGCAATSLFKDFNQVGENPGADLVLMSFADLGLCGNSPTSPSMCITDGSGDKGMGAFVVPGQGPGVYGIGALATLFGDFAIFDDAEGALSCPPVTGCFLRIGIDAGIPSTDDVTPLPPEPECDFIDGEPNCANPLCKQFVGCENFAEGSPEGLCEDGIDNDLVDGTDCADFGCDGFVVNSETGAQCESGGETSCTDEVDNDNNGFTDCGLLGGEADPNCEAIGACGTTTGDLDSGGCTVAAVPVTGGTAAANFLLPLLPLAGVFAVRRIIRRRKK